LALQRQEFEHGRKVTATITTDVVERAEDKKRFISDDKNRQENDNIQTTVIEDRQKKARVYGEGNASQKGQGLSLRVPDAPSLREPIHLARSLQPLMRRIATGRMSILDEVETVNRTAKQGICVPVMRSELEPWLDLALIVDESQSMLIWRHTIKDLQRLLTHYGIFRDIRIWGIKPDDSGKELQVFSRMGSNHRLASSKELVDQRPVETVSWLDAMEFCRRLSKHTRREYRLPSEAEWEYACRAGTTTPFHFGETITTDYVNYDGGYPYGDAPKGEDRNETTDVGSFRAANTFGLYDMHGNVWEWCADDWHDSYEEAPKDGSVWIKNIKNYEAPESLKLLRGGSWSFNAQNCRSAYRLDGDARAQLNIIGFRVVCILR